MIEIRSVEYTGSLEWTANGMSELSGLMEMCYALTGEFVTWEYVLVKTHPTAHLKLLNFMHLTYTSIKLV